MTKNLSEMDWQFLKERANLKKEDREWADEVVGKTYAESDSKIQELFGDCEFPPEDELEIIDSDLPHEKKVAQLQKLRAEKLKKDRIHAKGLGVLLD